MKNNNDQFVTESENIADTFVNHFKSIFNTSCPTVALPYSVMIDVSPTGPISPAEVSKAVKHLKPSKYVGLDGIPSFIISGCSDTFIPLLTYIFNLSIASENFPSLWKQTPVVTVFKKSSSTVVSNCRPISILHNFYKMFEFIMYDHLYCFF
jgi:hypothetical protein